MKLGGVTVLFNPTEKVVSNIESYIKQLDVLFLVDNTPNVDNSKLFNNKKIVYIPNKKNIGIAAALNIGAKAAIKEKCDWLLTMDQDSSFTGTALSKMKKFLVNYNEHKVDKLPISKIGLISPLHRIPQNEGAVYSGIDKPLLVMTSGNIVNLSAYKKVNGFKEWMFIDAVDFDFCLNLRDHGYEILQLNECELHHELGNTKRKKLFGKTLYVSNHSSFRRYFIVRNRHYILDMYREKYPDFCNAEAKMTKKELIKVWLYEKKKIKKTLDMYRGYRDYKKGIKGGYHGKN